MTKHSELGKELIQAMEEIVDYKRGKSVKGVTIKEVEIEPVQKYKPKDIKRIREHLHVSQKIFAELLGISTPTIVAWESGVRTPSNMALRLLDIISHEKRVVDNIIKIKGK